MPLESTGLLGLGRVGVEELIPPEGIGEEEFIPPEGIGEEEGEPASMEIGGPGKT